MAYSSVEVERSSGAVGSPLSSIFLVALLTAALGGVLADQATWASGQVVVGLLAYAAVSGVIAAAVGVKRVAGGFGIANQVTLLRAGLVCLIGGALLAGPSLLGWSLAALVAAALSLDAVDGWVARRCGVASGFGARFDLEVDSLLILILTVLVWQSGRVGAWVLAIGLVRYAFVLAGWRLRFLRAPLPPSRRRKAICVQQGVTLLLCLLPPVGATAASVGAALALGGLLVSFGADIIYLVRTRVRSAARSAVARDPDRAILVFHTGKGVIRRCAAIVPGSREKPRGDRA
jgi:phosphatidylglycerophosphate synthase